jgi:N-acylneuraminate cytidylyltransferase
VKRIAIIPARSGPKGLNNKNIIDLCGKPMMNYSIEAAIKAESFYKSDGFN